MTTVKELFDAMPASFQKEAAKGLSAVYQFNITGEGGGMWYAAIDGGELTVAQGQHASPGITLTAAAKDYVDIATGKVNRMMAFAQGKIKVAGNVALAMKMPQLFKQQGGTK